MREPPEWFVLADRMIWPILESAAKYFETATRPDTHIKVIPEAATLHFAKSLQFSMLANQQGAHDVAVSLARHCVEALAVMDAGVQPPQLGDELLRKWSEGSSTAGDLRKQLEKSAWPRYGNGLWQESWSEFFANLARAVQPFTHYGSELFQWQLAVFSVPELGENGKGLFLARLGAYDKEKASLITLLHALLAWAVARVFAANGKPCAVAGENLAEFTAALGKSEYLEKGVTDWSRQFAPHIWDNWNKAPRPNSG